MSKNTNAKLTLKTVALIAMILTFLAGAVFSVQLLILNMLPLAYSLLIVLVLVLIPVLMALAILRGGKKPLRYIVILILTVVIVGGCVFGSIALGKLQATLNAITGQEEDTNIYIGVYVRQDDPAAGIKDASGYTFAFTAEEGTWDPQEAIQGISLLTDFAAQTCRDAQEDGLAMKVELAGRVMLIALALPVMQALLTQIMSLAS